MIDELKTARVHIEKLLDAFLGAEPDKSARRKKALAWLKETEGMMHMAIQVSRTREDAVLPSKAHPSDAGYDLTLLGVSKQISETVSLYSTGLQVSPPLGYYLDLVPRSSISKTGYMLANSVGVIDPSYRGEVLVPLRKVDPDVPDLEFPVKLAQLVLRPLASCVVLEVESLDETERGTGGFGSTDKQD